MHYTLTIGRNSQNLYVGFLYGSQAGIEARFRIEDLSEDGPFELFRDILTGTIRSSKIADVDNLGSFTKAEEAVKEAYLSARAHIEKSIAAAEALGQEASFSDQTGLEHLADDSQIIKDGDVMPSPTI